MFYSHDLLTKTEHGVATVWLVATLGTSAGRRKIQKSEILNVDVPKACKTITNTSTPLALRTQSNLLFGVTRVYSDQCGFVLHDAENVRSQVRNSMSILRSSINSSTTTESHAVRSEQITLQDDPSFSLEMSLNMGLSDFDMTFGNITGSDMQDSCLLSIESQVSGLSPIDATSQYFEPMMDAFSVVGSNKSGHSRRDSSVNLNRNIRYESVPRIESVGELEAHLDLGIDPIDVHQNNEIAITQDDVMNYDGNNVESMRQIVNNDHNPDLDLPSINHDTQQQLYNDAQPFDRPQADGQQPPADDENDIGSETSSSTEVVDVVQARQVRRPASQIDANPEMDSTMFTHWANQYVQSMTNEAPARFINRGIAEGKSNARTWVTFSGLFGISSNLDHQNLPLNLRIFSIDKIIDAAKTRHGRATIATSPKRSHREIDGDEGEGLDERRIRQRLDNNEDEIGRADDLAQDVGLDDPQMNDVDHQTMEIVRQGFTPSLERRSSQAPWNLQRNSSRQGSVQPSVRAGSVYDHVGIGRGFSSVEGQNPPYIRHSSRSGVQSSVHRDTYFPVVDGIEDSFHLSMGHNDADLTGHDGRLAIPTYNSQNSQHATILNEFLTFVKREIDLKYTNIDDENPTDDRTKFVEFEEILPPSSMKRDVAANALMHVLALKSKAMLKIKQNRHVAFAPIVIKI